MYLNLRTKQIFSYSKILNQILLKPKIGKRNVLITYKEVSNVAFLSR